MATQGWWRTGKILVGVAHQQKRNLHGQPQQIRAAAPLLAAKVSSPLHQLGSTSATLTARESITSRSLRAISSRSSFEVLPDCFASCAVS